MSPALSRPVRLFHVAAYGEGRTGPLDHAARFVGTRAAFRAGLRHVTLAPGQEKASVGAWVPVDALTREEGGTFTTRAGREYESPTQVARHLENATGSCASVFIDIDKLPNERWATLLRALRAYSGEAWSTASYDPSKPTVSVRVHLHLDRELVDRGEVESVRRRVSVLLGGVADPMCFPATAVFYLPATRGHHFVEHFDGSELVVADLPAAALPSRVTRAARPVPVGYVATPQDLERAVYELGSLADRIRTCTSGLRKFAALAALSVGQRIAAGVLDHAASVEVLEEALRAQRDAHGDDRLSLDERLAELHSGIEDGLKRGPAIPADRATPKEIILTQAVELSGALPLATVLAEAAAKPLGTILALPPGVGKSRAALAAIAASRQDAIVYAPSHVLVEEHLAALRALGVPDDDIAHEVSPLHRLTGREEACQRSRASRPEGYPEDESSPFAKTVREAGINLRATICPKCPIRETCAARFEAPSRARVRLRVHAAYEPVDPGRAAVYLDEEPAPLELVELPKKALAALCGHAPVYQILTGGAHAHWSPAQVAAERARLLEEAELAGEEPQAWHPGQGYYVRQAALALRAGRVLTEDVLTGLTAFAGDLRLSAHVAEALALAPGAGLPADAEDLAAVRAVLRMALAPAGVTRSEDGSTSAILEAASLRDVTRGYVTLLSATPTPLAYPGTETYAPVVEDGCPGIVRDVLYLSHATNTNLKCAPTQVLETARRLLARRPTITGRVLVVTLKALVASRADELRALFPDAEVVLRWYGAVAGSNLFQEGGPLEVSTVITLGDYYANRRWMFAHLAAQQGLDEEAVDFAGRQQVAQELAQAHGRARDPRRRTPVTHIHIGSVLPLGWAGRISSTVFLQETDAEDRARAHEYLDGALRSVGDAGVQKECDVGERTVRRWKNGDSAIPDHQIPILKRLAGLA